MLKRISGLIGFVILSFTVATYAQLAVGDWQIYTSTGTPVKVIDTPQRVYYVSGKSFLVSIRRRKRWNLTVRTIY